MQAFDVQGAVSVVHVCTLKSFPSIASKTWKQRQTTYPKVSNDTSGVSCLRDRNDTEATAVGEDAGQPN